MEVLLLSNMVLTIIQWEVLCYYKDPISWTLVWSVLNAERRLCIHIEIPFNSSNIFFLFCASISLPQPHIGFQKCFWLWGWVYVTFHQPMNFCGNAGGPVAFPKVTILSKRKSRLQILPSWTAQCRCQRLGPMIASSQLSPLMAQVRFALHRLTP